MYGILSALAFDFLMERAKWIYTIQCVCSCTGKVKIMTLILVYNYIDVLY